MLKVIKKVGNARLCDFETVHGTIAAGFRSFRLLKSAK